MERRRAYRDKGDGVKIVRLTNKDADFYPLLGPFLSRRDIVAELGSPVWDEDGKVWFVAKFGLKVAGFAAYRTIGNRTALVSGFVLPEHRSKGIFGKLLEAQLSEISGEVTATAAEGAVASLRRAGFKKVGQRGRFVLMEKNCGNSAED